VRRPADIDRGGTLRIGLGGVDVRPRGSVQNEAGGQTRRRRLGDVPVAVRQRDNLVPGEGLDERLPELPARAGDQDAAVLSRLERIGDWVLQRGFTRGSSQGISCSSGSSGSYSSVTW